MEFEVCTFTPCDSAAAWHIDETSDSAAIGHLVREYFLIREKEYDQVYVQLKGHVTPHGQYGHMNAYSRSFVVEEVILVRTHRDGDCRK